jgi:membrane associated rhomboid family serine protease
MSESPPPSSQDPAGPDAPTCYRHSDRETYVSCVRCERPICPDCMRTASVGFQCVDCVAEGNRSVRPARTTFGGRLPSGAYVTWTLLAVIAAGFLAQQLQSVLDDGPPLSTFLGMVGLAVAPWGELIGVAVGEWYRLLTAAFLHVGWLHLAFNALALFIVGPQLERVLGHGRYAALWILSALGGSVLGYVVVPGSLSVGASGAIFGLFAATLIVGRRLGVDTRMIVVLIAVNLVITFAVPGIAWYAHIGGLVTGGVLALVYAYLPRGAGRGRQRDRARTLLHSSLTGGYAVLLLAGVVVQTMLLLNGTLV